MQQFLKIFHFNYSIEGAFLRLFCLSFQINKQMKQSILAPLIAPYHYFQSQNMEIT